MDGTTIQKLADFGQSIWLDNINRSIIENGKLKELIDLGLRGMTSNPSIFDKSIRLSNDYDARIEELCNAGKTTFEIYDDLTVKDVQDAADLFKQVYEDTRGLDGYVSLEVNPELAFKTEDTIIDAKRLFKKLGRPNVMMKVPATVAGYIAIEELIAEGININATLIFSIEQYENVARSYIKGLKKLVETGKDTGTVRSVASVFVSRIDALIDKMLDEQNAPGLLKGKAAVANSGVIFAKYLDIFSERDFKDLRKKGANLQRVLWASTSTKNPAYDDIKYVTELTGKDTVNTLPGNTLKAFLDHGVIKAALGPDAGKSNQVMRELKDNGIDLKVICESLLDEGVSAFQKSFSLLLDSIEAKLAAIKAVEKF